VISMETVDAIYKVVLVIVFKTISLFMIIVGIIIALCIIIDNIFRLGWGYPWWSLPFCIIYIVIAVTIYKFIPNVIVYIKRLRDGYGSRNSSG
jgi:hypothetical protein